MYPMAFKFPQSEHTCTHRLPLYPGPGRRGSRFSRLSRDTQTSLSPDTSSSSSGGSPKRHSPSSVSWAVPWNSSRWDVPGTPPEEGVQEASDIGARATSNGSS
ncbi:hypothetical protein ILYODFUR_009532 [Ilyodon furcidens]|uniref:Uncharacterized protein n=1 Tax=Ilyodon furcidens TaxID=33524 RepID=A0ABV0V1N8_9TELE